MMNSRCLALYSGGLDSIVSVKLMQDQGIDVIPLYFATPFFGLPALLDPELFRQGHLKNYNIQIHLIDYTDDFIEMIAKPLHGFGKHLNPCIDCKIGMLKKTHTLLTAMHASFVITGEVLGQRPMSQRRDAMHIIERDSGLKDILLRPLCAHHMPPTLPERIGIVNRGALLEIAGRGRKIQEDLARSYGITNIPTPAGGCLLTYEQIAAKVRQTFERCAPQLPSRYDILLDVVGRKFLLDAVTVLMVSRNEHENNIICRLTCPGNIFLKIAGIPGPLCILRGNITRENLEKASSICLRYSKARGKSMFKALWGITPYAMDQSVDTRILSDDVIKGFQVEGNRSRT
jgi:tRNA U34 2-thiouridine synthase MnmA/TrmU